MVESTIFSRSINRQQQHQQQLQRSVSVTHNNNKCLVFGSAGRLLLALQLATFDDDALSSRQTCGHRHRIGLLSGGILLCALACLRQACLLRRREKFRPKKRFRHGAQCVDAVSQQLFQGANAAEPGQAGLANHHKTLHTYYSHSLATPCGPHATFLILFP